MSKPNKNTSNTTPTTANTPADPPVAEAEATTATESAMEDSTPATAPAAEPTAAPAEPAAPVALATVQEAGLDKPKGETLDTPFSPTDPDACDRLVALFPDDERYLRQVYKPVLDEEIREVLKDLDPAKAKNFALALERMNPIKPGDHGKKRQGLQMFEARIYHGTGDDSSRPKMTPTGGIYGTDGTILAACDRDSAEALSRGDVRVPERFEGFVIAGYEVNTFWPPRGEDGDAKDAKASDGDEPKSKAPICRSIDQIMGDKFGACAACPERPFKDNRPNKNACRNEVHLYFVPRDFSGIYRMVLSGTNTKPGRAIRKAYSAGWRYLWDYAFAISTEKETDPKDASRRWFLVTHDVMRSAAPTEAEAKFLSLICRKIDTEYYWLEKRRIHLKILTGGAEKPSGEADFGALMGGSGGEPPANLTNLANQNM